MSWIVGRCEGCKRAWKIPDPRKPYVCRACGGPVVAARDAFPSAGSSRAGFPAVRGEILRCGGCGAALDADALSCAVCGTLRGAPVGEEGAARRAAGREYGRVKRIVGLLRVYYVGSGIFAFLGFLLLLLLGPEKTVPLTLFGSITALSFWASADIHRRPFLWSLILACLATAALVPLLILNETDPFRIIRGWLAVAVYWGILGPAWRLQALLRAYPEFALKPLSGRSLSRSLARRERTLARLRRRRWILAAVLLTGFVVWAGTGIYFASRQASPAADATSSVSSPGRDAIPRFREAWGAADIEGIIGLMVPEDAGVLGSSLRQHVAHRGWERALPRLTGSKISWTRGSTVAEVLHTYNEGTGKGLLEVHWEYREPEWLVRGIRFP